MWIIISFLLLCTVLLMAFKTENGNDKSPYIMYKGEKYYYCKIYYQIDTLVTPDGSLQIFNSSTKIYNHFGCEGIK